MSVSFQVGDKVKIPTTKTAKGYCGVNFSAVVKDALRKGQEYIFVTWVTPKFISCDNYATGKESGDYFSPSDLELYVPDQVINKYEIY